MDFLLHKLRLARRFHVLKMVFGLILLALLWQLSDLDVEEIVSKKQSIEVSRIYNASSLYRDQLVHNARSKAWCLKPAKAKEYVVCSRLPYTSIKCGECLFQCTSESNFGGVFKVPNIIHFVWFGDPLNITSFLHYLALRSAASIQRPSLIYLHYNAKVVVRSEHLTNIVSRVSSA